MKFFEDSSKLYFIGIGGIGMSGLARLFAAQGKEVLGSDAQDSSTVEELRADEISVFVGHDEGQLPDDTELVIYSEAIPEDNEELMKARDLEIPTMTYFEALGKVTDDYHLVAVAGSHGKTTTTAMLSLILVNAGLDPTVIVGSKLKEFGNRNVRVGTGEVFVVEACEYRRNFMSLHPNLLGVTNIELDHIDYFKSQEDYELAFQELADQSEEVVWPDEISEYERDVGVPGNHNLLNAGMAAHLARRLGVSEEIIAESLAAYEGAWRRFEYRGTSCGALIYDDYAHHPTEIQATLQGAREKYPESRIVAVFQPHQYSRTAALLDAFADAFEDADEVIIPNIYAARDSAADKAAVSSEALVDAIADYHDEVRYGDGLENTAEYLLDTIQDGDLVLIMGAGDVNSIIPRILDEGKYR